MTGWRKRTVYELIEANGLDLHGDIEHFAELVREDEREACAKLCDVGVDTEHPAVKGHIMKNFGASSTLAKAIRARGDKHD